MEIKMYDRVILKGFEPPHSKSFREGVAPIMVVQYVDDYSNKARARWFDKKGHLQERDFLLTALEKVE